MLDKEHRTKTVAAVADIILGEIKGFLQTFQNFRQATLYAVDTNNSLSSPLEKWNHFKDMLHLFIAPAVT